MQSSPFKKLLLGLLLLAMGAALLLHFINSELKPQEKAPPKISKSGFEYHYTPPALPVSNNKPEAEPESDAAGQPKLPREKVEAWLAKHNRNAASLLAAFCAQGDTNYLNEAATNFPNDPHVELAVLAHDEFPADRHKWLDLFKASSPNNSLANYFSARDYFKNGQSDAAIQELLAANSKPQFDDYAIESRLNSEEVNQFAGQSPLDSARAGLADMSGDTLTEFSTLKGLSSDMQDLQKQQLTAGDTGSVQNLAQAGAILADQLRNGDSGKMIIDQLVANAIEAKALAQLNPNASYDFLGGETPTQVLQEFKLQKAAYVDLLKKWNAAYPNMTEAEMVNYHERSKIYGETEAMKWVIQQHPPTDSTK